MKYKAIYEFHAENDDELTFAKDDIIVIDNILDEEWAKGKLVHNGNVGLFPLNFVVKMHDDTELDFENNVKRIKSLSDDVDKIVSPFDQLDNNSDSPINKLQTKSQILDYM